VAPLKSFSLLVPEIKALLAEQEFSVLKDVLKECSALDLAECWSDFSHEQRVALFMLLGTKAAIQLFESIDIESQRFLLNQLNEEAVVPLLEGAAPADIARVFHRLPERAVKKMTSLVKREEALQKIQKVMTFPQNSAGSLMHPEFVKLLPKMTARHALSILQAVARPHEKQHLFALYVTDESGKLVGASTLQDLVSAPEDATLSDLMTSTELVKVSAHTDQEEVAKIVAKYDVSSVPVVDEENRLMGVLTVDDIIDVIRHEATEDIAKMVGTKAEDISARSAFRIARLRLPWLITTLVGELVVSIIIRHYEFTLSKIVALAAFLPLIAAMGGNVGAQSATIVVRGLATGQILRRNMTREVLKEFRVGVILGVCYGMVLAIMAFVLYGDRFGPLFPLVVGMGMCLSMIVASTAGAVEPFVLSHFGVDPATATGPLITTTTDLISTSAYFLLATLILL